MRKSESRRPEAAEGLNLVTDCIGAVDGADRDRTACERLLDPYVSLAEISLATGFADQSHFTRVFVQRVGLTPRSWQRVTMS